MTKFALAACLAVTFAAGAARADTLTTSSTAWQAAANDATETTSFGLPYYGSTSSVTLADGNVLNTTGDTVGASGTGWAPFTNGYGGDILITNGTSETINFGTALTAFGLYVSPDVGIAIPGFLGNATFTVTLSNGQSTQVNGLFAAGDTQFFGFTGVGDITSMTISVSGTNGFGGAIPDFAFGDFFSVPEPGSLALVGVGLLGLVGVRAKKRK